MGEQRAEQATKAERAGLTIGLNLALLGGSCLLLLFNVVSGPLLYQALFLNNGGDQVDGTIPGPWLIVPFFAVLLAGGVVVVALLVWCGYLLIGLARPSREAAATLTGLVVAFAGTTFVASALFHLSIYTSIADRDPFWGLS